MGTAKLSASGASLEVLCCVLENESLGSTLEKDWVPPLEKDWLREKEGRCIIIGCVLDHDGLGPLPPFEKDWERENESRLEKDCAWLRE